MTRSKSPERPFAAKERTYKKAHHHEAGAHIFTVTGKGYSLLWTEGETEFIRFDWKPGMVSAPVERQFHQHFTTSQPPLALPRADRRRQRTLPAQAEEARL